MNDKVIQIEVALNFLNTLFGKAVYFKDAEAINELNVLRRGIYHDDDFVYERIIQMLQDREIKLQRHEQF